MFSRISKKLSQTNAQTLPKLHQIIEDSFTPVPHVETLESIWNCKEVYVGQRKIIGVKSPHVFKFELDANDQVQASVKDWPLDEEQYRSEPLPEIPDISANLSIVVPRLEKMQPLMSSLLDDLPKYQRAGRLSEADVNCWKVYLQKLQARRRPPPAIHSIVVIVTKLHSCKQKHNIRHRQFS